MFLVSTLYPKAPPPSGTVTGLVADVPIGGITGVVSRQEAGGRGQEVAPISGQMGIVTAVSSYQPMSVSVEGSQYRQVAVDPLPGEYTYNPDTEELSINLIRSVPTGGQVYLTPPPQPVAKVVQGTNQKEFALVDREEIGADAWDLLKTLNATGIIRVSRSKGNYPRLTLELAVRKSEAAATRALLSDTSKVYYFFGIPYYQLPYNESELLGAAGAITSDTYAFQVTYQSIHSPRGDLSPLDQFIPFITPTAQTPTTGVGGQALPSGRFLPSDISPENVRRISQLTATVGVPYQGNPLVTSTSNANSSDRVSPRQELQKMANAAGGYLDYEGDAVRIITPSQVPEHHIDRSEDYAPYQITRNGIPGASVVDGVLLSTEWSSRPFQPDQNGQGVNETEEQSPTFIDETADLEKKIVPDGDEEPSSPSIVVTRGNVGFRDNSQVEIFQDEASKPGSVAYPNGFTKQSSDVFQQQGQKLDEVNGQVWGWKITSLDVWEYEDPFNPQRPGEQYTLDPIWKRKELNADNFWQQMKTYNSTVSLDGDGYKTLDLEVGTEEIQVRTESDREAAQLNYDADKLEYEASVLEGDGDFDGAIEKRDEAEIKRKEIELYKFRKVPYENRTTYIYGFYSEGRDEFPERSKRSPCTPTERDDEDEPEPTPRYEASVISLRNTLYTVENPNPNEPPITYGAKEERVKSITLVPGSGWRQTELVKSNDVSANSGAEASSNSDFTQSPPIAQRVRPVPRRERAKPTEETNNPTFVTYFSTPGGLSYQRSARSPVSIPGVRSLLDAEVALQTLIQRENLNAEQTQGNYLFRRNIAPGHTVWEHGKRWEVQSINAEYRLIPGFKNEPPQILCSAYNAPLGSKLNIPLSSGSVTECSR